MAVVAIGAMAAGATTALGYGAYAALAYSIATTVATAYLRTPNNTTGPRLTDLSVTGAAYGTTINSVYGTIRTNALTMWTSGKQERRHKEKTGSKGFGKQDSNTTYTYDTSIAFLISRNKIKDVRKVLIDGQVVLDRSKENQSITTSLSYSSMKIYKGDDDQEIDPVMFAKDGKKTPAYNGYSYIIFENLDLSLWGGNIPNFTFEVIGESIEDPSLNYNVFEDGPYKNSNGYVVFDNDSQKRYHVFETVEIVDMLNNTVKEKDVIFAKQNGMPIFPAGDLIFQQSYYQEYHKGLVKIFDTDMVFKGTIDIETFNFWDNTVFSSLNLCHAMRVGLSSYVLFATANNYLAAIYIADIYNVSLLFNNYYHFNLDNIHQQGYSDLAYNTKNNQCDTPVVFDGARYFLRLKDSEDNINIYSFDLLSPWEIARKDFTLENGSLMQTKPLFCYDQTNDCLMTGFIDNNEQSNNKVCIAKLSLENDDVEIKNIYNSYLSNLNVVVGDSPFFFNKDESKIGIVTIRSGDLLVTNVSINNLNSFDLFEANGYDFNSQSLGYNPTYWNSKMQYIFGGPTSGYSNFYYRVLINRLNPQSQSIYKIIKKMCVDSGMRIEDVDTSDVEDIMIRGYVDSSGGDLEATINVLLELFDIETIKTNYIVKFKKSKRNISAIINSEQLGVQEYAEDATFNDYFVTENTEEKALPSSVSITYFDVDNNYQQTTQRDDNHYAIVENNMSNEYAVALTANEAKRIVQRQLDTSYISRYKYSFSLDYNYYDLEAGDVIQINDKDLSYVMKISQIDSDVGIVKINASSYDNIVYDQYGVGSIGEPNQSGLFVKAISDSNLKYLNLPLLNNSDFVGAYVAVDRRSQKMKWNGAVLEQSIDGLNYTDRNVFDRDAVCGSSLSVLSKFDGGNVFDCFNSVDIECDSELESKTEIQILNGENTCLLGDEILQFLNAELIGEGKYRLSGLLRSRFQTVNNKHSISEEFILLEKSTIQPLLLETSAINTVQYYKAITFGQNSNDKIASGYIYSAENKKPMALSRVDYNINENKDYKFYIYEVLRGQQYLQPYSTPYDMDDDNYSADIMNGLNVVRTIDFKGNTFDYSSEKQVQDFGSIQSKINVNFYKLNKTVGRGKVFNLQTI